MPCDRANPRHGEVWRHFKGNLYRIEGVASHSETMESLVVYRKMFGDFSLWVRPLDMFMSEVDHDRYPNVEQKFRFERV